MKLFVESELPVDSKTAWELFDSREFESRLEEAANISCELLGETMEGAIKVRRLKFTSKSELPGMVAKALGSKNLTYEQTNRFNAETGRLDWSVKLPVLTDRVSVVGVTTIKDTPKGSRRVVDGDISVKMAIVGGRIEKAVVAEFEKSMQRAVELLQALAKEKGLT